MYLAGNKTCALPNDGLRCMTLFYDNMLSSSSWSTVFLGNLLRLWQIVGDVRCDVFFLILGGATVSIPLHLLLWQYRPDKYGGDVILSEDLFSLTLFLSGNCVLYKERS
jgi:hypothetical protein